jgi:hypothetical protein
MLVACESKTDEFWKNHPHAQSPDKKAVVYQSSFKEDGLYRVAVTTWIEVGFMKGGAGIFDIRLDTLEDLKFEWTSDTSVKITYPDNARVLRQEKQTYFAGRNTHISYKVGRK